MLVLPHPLHAHRQSRLLREQRRVRGRVLVTVAAVAARALDVDAAHVVGLHAQHVGDLLAQQMRLLRRTPAGELAVLVFRHRA